MNASEKINIQIHPRAFSAFGSDLVTNDSVAIAELVKNCYDAFALFTEVSFGKDKNGEPYIQIMDNGFGMTRAVIKTAWATIATPFKQKYPWVERIINGKKKIRRVSGNKGLGRFSAARLGSRLRMITKSENEPCLIADFDWDKISESESLNDCYLTLREYENDPFKEVGGTGTIIRIQELKSIWDDNKVSQLVEDLSRLISPFEKSEDFTIRVKFTSNSVPVEISPPAFINNPVYKIFGTIDGKGVIHWDYAFHGKNSRRNNSGTIPWQPRNEFFAQLSLLDAEDSAYSCGSFSFEIRAWDLDSDSIGDVSDTFNIARSDVRKSISKFKGLSVYRDNVLVLPKSDASRDWLGLDAKRISDIGRRISTSQIVGIINISAESNPGIRDTTDREKLVDTIEYQQFVQVVNDIIDKLQSERTKDRIDQQKRANLNDLISPLSAKPLLEKAEYAASRGTSANAIVGYIKEYHEKNEKSLEQLNTRLIYYAQTASLGSVAVVILHEFLTGTTAIKRFLNRCKRYLPQFDDKTREYMDDANNGHQRITEVAKSFTPLYRQNLRAADNLCNLHEMADRSIRLIKAKKMSKDIDFNNQLSADITVAMHESELQTIFINLLDNACYWISQSGKSDRRIEISVEKLEDSRVQVNVSDSGSGVAEEDAVKIFNPGVTSKPRGIGMGLVIISELLSNYEGKIGTRIPGDIGGATFIFDVPIK